MPRRYCISGAWYSNPNIGDQAILATVVHMVRAIQPDAHFSVFTSRPSFVREHHDVAAFHIKKRPWRVLSALARADVYIIGGGTPFYVSFSNLMNFFITALVARLFRTKVMVYAVSTRDLYTWWSRLITGWVLRLANVVTIREKATVHYLRTLYPRLTVEPTSDPAIVIDELSEEDGRRLLLDAGLPETDQPLYGISCRNFETGKAFNVHHYEEYTAETIETYWTALARAADVLAERGVVIFFPMNTVPPDDDRVSAEKIQSRMTHGEKALIVREQFTPVEAAAVLAQFRCMVASRLHATVISASQYVPSIGLSYGHKTAGFLSSLLPDEFIFNINTMEAHGIVDAVVSLLDNYEDIVSDFRRKVDHSKAMAHRNAEFVSALGETQQRS